MSASSARYQALRQIPETAVPPSSATTTSSSQIENAIACRALETHASAQPPVTVVVFHQRDKQDQARLAVLLKENSDGAVEVQANEGKWFHATVARLKSCFGRGLLFLPAEAGQIKGGDAFLLRFPPKKSP